VNETPEIRDLLTQIRDLLIPIAAVNRPQYEEIRKLQIQQYQKLLASKVLGAKSRKATLLMDGTRPQSDIAKESGVDRGNLSKLIKELREAELLDAKSNPCLVLTVSQAQEAFAG
jgi:DNA-binding MarR family transcriptional regulator